MTIYGVDFLLFMLEKYNLEYFQKIVIGFFFKSRNYLFRTLFPFEILLNDLNYKNFKYFIRLLRRQFLVATVKKRGCYRFSK